MTLQLDEPDAEMLAGGLGPGVQLAMRIVSRMAEAEGATRLIDVTRAHNRGIRTGDAVSLSASGAISVTPRA